MSSLYINSLIDFLEGLPFPVLAAIFFGSLILLLCSFILIRQNTLRRREAKLSRWTFIIDHIIRDAIFFEGINDKDPVSNANHIIEANKPNISERLKRLLPDRHFRLILTAKLVRAKRNMSGVASENLTQLFRQLKLDKRALMMLDDSSWYMQASAIQQLSTMELSEYKEKIFEYINHKRALVRIEAQNAVLKFYGFEGLRFLDQVSYPITEWQQIKLLDELSHLPPENFTGFDIWLNSENVSVVIFALKLVRIYQKFEPYDQVLECLKHANPEVRRQAIHVLQDLPNDQTASVLISIFPDETARNRIAILRVLESVSTGSDISFLLGLLDDSSNEIKVSSARTLASLGNDGMEALQLHRLADEYPLNQIIAQIREERI